MTDIKKMYFQRTTEQLALEYNAKPENFTKEGLTLTLPAKPEGVRLYSHDVPFFAMATTGNSVVMTADECLHGKLRQIACEAGDLHRLYEFCNLRKIDELLREYGHTLKGLVHMYLPGGPFESAVMPEGFTYKWFETEEAIAEAFYPNERFTMALSEGYNADRPDVIALAAYENGEIVGVAGASADTEDMWQVGIDVLPQYRGRGLGTALVKALCKRIEEKGCLPFYGTAAGNIHSQIIAVRCGFYPAWTETVTYKL